jgi:hypothetical protein
MRKFLGFAAVVAALALGTAIWAKSGSGITTDGIAQPRTEISLYEMMSNAKNLPVQEIADYF